MIHTHNYRRVGVLSLALMLLVLMLAVYQPTPIQGQDTEIPTMEPGIAEDIRSGAIDVGDDYTLDLRRARFHEIHAEVLELDCEACHMEELTGLQEIFYTQDKPESEEPPVPRGVCLVCHQGGEATELYGPGE